MEKSGTLVLSIIILLLAGGISIGAIVEITSREQFSDLMDRKITSLQSEFIKRIGPITTSSKAQRSNQLDPQDQLLNEIRYLEKYKDMVQALKAAGADFDFLTLPVIRYAINLPVPPEKLESWFNDHKQLSIRTTEKTDSVINVPWGFRYFSSDFLLAIAVLSCGVIGSLIAGVRREDYVMLKKFALGLGAGFIVYLGIKGGRYVFLMGSAGELIPINPYSSAFVGVLAGLFTERAYQFLSATVEEFLGRLEASMKGAKAE